MQDVVDCALEIHCLTHLKKIIFIWLFYLTPNVKQAANELPTHFVSSLTFSINPMNTYCISWSFGVSTFDLFHPKWYMTISLSIWPVPRKDSGTNTNFYFPKGGPNFESKTIPHVCSVLGCRLLTDKFARRWFLS